MMREKITPYRPSYYDDPRAMQRHNQLIKWLRQRCILSLMADVSVGIRWGQYVDDGEVVNYLEIYDEGTKDPLFDLTTYEYQ